MLAFLGLHSGWVDLNVMPPEGPQETSRLTDSGRLDLNEWNSVTLILSQEVNHRLHPNIQNLIRFSSMETIISGRGKQNNSGRVDLNLNGTCRLIWHH